MRCLPHLLSAALVAVALSQPADAALIRDYRLDGNLADQLGNAALTTIGAVDVGATGVRFDQNEGLQIGISLSTYSVEVAFSFDQTNGYRRILDFLNRTSDSGLYNLDTSLNFFTEVTGPAGAFAPLVPVRVVFTRNASDQLAVGYVNGVQAISFTDDELEAVIGTNLTFFADNVVGPSGEASAGFADYIRIYDTALSATEVAALVPPLPGTGGNAVPEPATWGMMLLGFGLAGGALRRRTGGKPALA